MAIAFTVNMRPKRVIASITTNYCSILTRGNSLAG
jgi:hypothetical protein